MRKWTLGAWFFLSMGLTLGMLWAYEELGWGGFWAWDPVENAGFLPWLTATAFLHSIMIQERRGMMKIWNVTLIILTFFLTIFGTFMTRSGIVQSVHAFGQDTQLAWIFTIFMVLILIVSFGFVIKRLPGAALARDVRIVAVARGGLHRQQLDPAVRGVLHLFATMFPTLSEAIRGERITVGPPFFNKWMVPIGITLLFLTGVGPLASPGARRRRGTCATSSRFPYWRRLPRREFASAPGLKSSWAAVINFSLCAMVFTTISQEFIRNLAIRKKNTGGDVLSAAIGMVLRNRRRYGGYLVHIGIVLMFLGFAGTAYQKESEARVAPGQTTTIGKYAVRFDRLAHEEDRQKEMVTGEITASVDGKVIEHMRPARWFFHGHESEPTTEVAIRRSPAEDLYITLGNYDLADGTATLKLVVNPLVNWIWFGFMLLAFGTGIALLPEALLEKLTARVPQRSGAGTSGAAGPAALALVVGLGLLLGAGMASPARADDMTDPGRAADAARDRRELAGPQHHLPVRKLPPQPARVRVGKLRPRRAGSDRDPQSARPGEKPRGRHPVLHPEIRQPGRAGGAHRQGLQPPGLGAPLRIRHRCRRNAGLRCLSADPPPARAGRGGGARLQRPGAARPARGRAAKSRLIGVSLRPLRALATAPPSTKGKNPGNTAGHRLTPDAGVNASTTSPRQRRRPPVVVWGLGGAIAAGVYGHLVLAMRFGPPLVMVALGGLTLVLGAAALWRVVDPLTRAEVAATPETRAPHRTPRA